MSEVARSVEDCIDMIDDEIRPDLHSAEDAIDVLYGVSSYCTGLARQLENDLSA